MNKLSFAEYVRYIGSDFAKSWLLRPRNQTRGVFIPLDFIAICEGNLHQAAMLSQIAYWHEVNPDTMQPRLTHRWKDHLWIVKQYHEWEAECGINERTARRAIDSLEKRGLIIKDVSYSPFHKNASGGNEKACFIRLNWNRLEELFAVMALKDSFERTNEAALEKTETVSSIYTENVSENISNKEMLRALTPHDQEKFSEEESGRYNQIVSEVWDTTSPGIIAERLRTLRGEHHPDSKYALSNVVPPATPEEIKEMAELYRRECPELQIPTKPEQIQHWIYRLRDMLPGYLTYRGHYIALKVKVPKKKLDTHRATYEYIKKYYPEEFVRVKSLYEYIDKELRPQEDMIEAGTWDFVCEGEKVKVHVPIPKWLIEAGNGYAWEHVVTDHPAEAARLELEFTRIKQEREHEKEQLRKRAGMG